MTKFEVGQYVLLKYPNMLPDKLSALYRGSMEIFAWSGSSGYHQSQRTDQRKCLSRSYEQVATLLTIQAPCWDDPWGVGGASRYWCWWILCRKYCRSWRKRSKYKELELKFQVRWSVYEPDEDSWLNWTRSRTWLPWIFIAKNIRNSNRVEDYKKRCGMVDIRERESSFLKCCKILDTLCEN